MSTGLDVSAFQQARHGEFDTRTDVLGIAHSDLALVIHFGLCVCVCVCVCARV